MKSINNKCPCGSGLKYKKCCKPFHDGKLAKNALELMKSRYSAYAYEKVNYIVKTTYDIKEDIEHFKQSVMDFSKNTKFIKLDIYDFKDGANDAYVTFRATLENSGKDCSFTEESKFIKIDGSWLYIQPYN